jgi:hypothetical protein
MDPHRHHNDERLLQRLIYGWGNESWSAKSSYLIACLGAAFSCSRPILECGSGLSTILLGIVARSTGTQVWSLEHNHFWANHAIAWLTRLDVHSVTILVRPLREYGPFVWYGPPLDLLPSNFGLAVCDGPPGETHGGRYGLLPIMRGRLEAGCIILIDDAEREREEATAAKWASELNTSFEVLGDTHRYARLVVPGCTRA